VPPLAGWIKIHDRYQERAECTQKDVKNEGRSDYVYENKGNDDKMTEDLAGFLPKTHRFRDNGRKSIGFLHENASICGIDSATDPHPVSGLSQEGSLGGKGVRRGEGHSNSPPRAQRRNWAGHFTALRATMPLFM
jgi:hypothetical protein